MILSAFISFRPENSNYSTHIFPPNYYITHYEFFNPPLGGQGGEKGHKGDLGVKRGNRRAWEWVYKNESESDVQKEFFFQFFNYYSPNITYC